jgi:branched-chain amino acid aminotransferase
MNFSIEKVTSATLKPLPAPENLGFGRFFSDHMFYSKYREGRGWYESKIIPYGPLALDPAAAVFHYGQALFEGMKAFRQESGRVVLFRPEFNWQRLSQGAERLCLVPPPQNLFMQSLKELLQLEDRWIPEDPSSALYIRPTLIGTEGFLGVRPSQEVMFYVLLSPVGAYYGNSFSKPVRIWVEDQAIRAAPGGLGATKAGANYAASLKSSFEAKQKGFDQVLWLDSEFQGIEEVGTMNVFFIFKDEIVTPELNGSILAGGVRDCALQLLRNQNLGKKVVERKITISEIVNRHQKGELLEAFGTGTAAVITAIGELQYKSQTLVIHQNSIGPISQSLLNRISAIQRGNAPDDFAWVRDLSEL